MAGAVRRMAVYLGLVEDDSYNDDYLDDSRDSQGRDSQSRDSQSRNRSRTSSRRGFADDYDYEEAPVSRSVRPIPESRGVRTIRRDEELPSRSRVPDYAPPARAIDFARIETIHPRSYNDARRIGEEYRDGIPVITLSIPCRYTHTVAEAVHKDDIEATIRLLIAFLEHSHEFTF